MKKILLTSLCLALCLSLAASLAMAKEVDKSKGLRYEMSMPGVQGVSLDRDMSKFKGMTAAVSTTFITTMYDFDTGPNCDMQSWVTVDITEPTGLYWHVADATELDGGTYGRLNVLRDLQSLWCGLPYDTVAFPQCGWVEAPGYGNGWTQLFATKACVAVENSVEMEYVISVDSESNYDATYVEVSACGADTWVLVDGGKLVFDDIIVDSTHVTSITGFDSSSIEIRFRFNSDGAWSDEDGLYVGDGAAILDNLVVRDNTGDVVALENFEGEATGDLSTEDWQNVAATPFGDYAGLYRGLDAFQEDLCFENLTCFWEFFDGANTSTFDYACAPHHGGHPGILAMPHGDANIGYMSNEVWSPQSPWIGTGTAGNVEFDVYRDMPLDNLQFYVWHVRSWEGVCAYNWVDRNFVYYGDDLAWIRPINLYADVVRPAASTVQFAMGAVDMKGVWGPGAGPNPVGSGACHSPAPYLDNFVAYRLPFVGPAWSIRDIDQFQDTFPRDGSLTGVGRADMANDPAHGYQEPEYFPGDSAGVQSCTDNVSGLVSTGLPPYFHRSVYCFVSVRPYDAAKMGVNLENSDPYGAGNRFVHRGDVVINGQIWSQMNCDRRRNSGGGVLSNTAFCIDLPDNLFEAGDTIEYFYGAFNSLNQWSYHSRYNGIVYTIEEAAAFPNEFQILPGAGDARGGDILYVDGMDGRGAQAYFDVAFQQLAIYDLVDRFDVNGPSSGVSNRLGTRVYDVAQLATPYRKILWNTGDLSTTIGDGTGNPEKSDDWLVLDAFLTALETAEATGGLYLNGDDLPSVWANQVGASAVAARAWLDYALPVGGENHVPQVGVSPFGVGLTAVGTAFGDPANHPLGVDTLVAFGGCPAINDFDWVTPQGAAATQMTYEGVGDLGPGSANAIIGQKTAAGAGEIGVLMSGFSFHYIRDDRLTAELDRVHHLKDVLAWLGNDTGAIVGAGDAPKYSNSLAQNYPNPFNPTTTIAFTVKDQAQVSLKIYNVAGQLVKTLVNDVRTPGITHVVSWDGRNNAGQSVSSGVYFYKLVTKDFTKTRKMVLLK